jgi:hypothetical protein
MEVFDQERGIRLTQVGDGSPLDVRVVKAIDCQLNTVWTVACRTRRSFVDRARLAPNLETCFEHVLSRMAEPHGSRRGHGEAKTQKGQNGDSSSNGR